MTSLKKDISKEPWWRDKISEPLKHPWQVTRERFVGDAPKIDLVSILLSRVGSGEPGLSIEEEPFMRSYMTHIVYRDPKGKPVMAATLTPNNEVLEMGLDKNRGLLSGRAAKAVFNELKARGTKHPVLPASFGAPIEEEWEEHSTSDDARRLIHKYSVQQALKEGKPVPPEVLADYPELRPSAAAPSPTSGVKEEEDFSNFKSSVVNHFNRTKDSLHSSAQSLVPEVKIHEVKLGGSYASGSPTPASDVDLEVHYSGDIEPLDVTNRLSDKLTHYGGGAYDIHPFKIKPEQIQKGEKKSAMVPQNVGDAPNSAKAGTKDTALVSQGSVYPKTAIERINEGSGNYQLLQKFVDESKKDISQKVGIFNSEGKVLILRDSDSEWWDLPGGKMYTDESSDEALKREVHEETKLGIDHLKFLTYSFEKLGENNKLVLIFSANIDHEMIPKLSKEHRGFEWITEDEIDNYKLGLFKPILRFIMQNKKESIQKSTQWVNEKWDPDPLSSPDVVSGGKRKPLLNVLTSEDKPSFLNQTPNLNDKVIEEELDSEDKENASELLNLNKQEIPLNVSEESIGGSPATTGTGIGRHKIGFASGPHVIYNPTEIINKIKNEGLHPDGHDRGVITKKLDKILNRPSMNYSFPYYGFRGDTVKKSDLFKTAFIIHSPEIAKETKVYDLNDHVKFRYKPERGLERIIDVENIDTIPETDFPHLIVPKVKEAELHDHESWKNFVKPEFAVNRHIPRENLVFLEDLEKAGLEIPGSRNFGFYWSTDEIKNPHRSLYSYPTQDVAAALNLVIRQRKQDGLLKQEFPISRFEIGERENHLNSGEARKQYIEPGQTSPHNEPILTGPRGGIFYYAKYSSERSKEMINNWFERKDAAALLSIAFGTSKKGINIDIVSIEPMRNWSSYDINNVHISNSHSLNVEASIRNASGAKIGSLHRKFRKTTDPSNTNVIDSSVYHSSFFLGPRYQNQGIGTDILQNSEHAYKILGIPSISLLANDDVGGYAWALQGFDFALQDADPESDIALGPNLKQFCSSISRAWRTRDFNDVEDFIRENFVLNEMVSPFRDESSPETEQQALQQYSPSSQKSKILEWIKSQHLSPEELDIMDDKIPKLTHSWDFALFNPSNAPYGDHLGKKLMIGSSWSGIKDLNEESLSYKVGEAYRKAKDNAKINGG